MKIAFVFLSVLILASSINAQILVSSNDLKSQNSDIVSAQSQLPNPSFAILYSSESQNADGNRISRKVFSQNAFSRPLLVEETYSNDAQGSPVLLNKVEMVADQMLVKMKKNSSKNEFKNFCLNKSFSVSEEIYGSDGLFLVDIPLEGADSLKNSISLAKQNSDVEYAEPNYILHAFLTPNDPKYTDNTLWGMNKISCPSAWDINTGSHDIVVGVIDTGVDYNHNDIKDNMWINSGEIPYNGIDDDGNGFVDDIYGYDFVNNDADPMDDQGHGSHCAGTIGGVGNNGIGIVGVCWKVKIMALKFLNASGSGTTDGAIKCVNYATLMKAHLTSNSWGGGGFSQSLKDAIDANGKLFVAAAGNGGSDGIGDDNDSTPNYPSNYDCPNIIAVAATDNNDDLALFSNYGATTVDIAAPGVNIYSAKPGGSYQTMSGTSMATPHVAGAAALLLSAAPAMDVSALKSALMNNVDIVAGLNGTSVTGGRLNVAKSINSLAYLSVVSPNGGELWGKGKTYEIKWTSRGISDKVKIELLKNGELNMEIVAETENNGTYKWLIPENQTLGDDYKIRITDATNPQITDESDALFSIIQPFLEVLTPNGGEIFNQNYVYTITWTSGGISADSNVKISLLEDNKVALLIKDSTKNSGMHEWTVSKAVKTGYKYKILVESLDTPEIKDESDAFFSINSAPIYKLTMLIGPADSGTTVPPVGTITEIEGGLYYNISAQPANGFYFSGWKVEGNAIVANSAMQETTIVLYGDSTVTATFSDIPPENVSLTISISPLGSGETTPPVGVHPIIKNIPLSIKAVPIEGYQFVKWTLTGSGSIEDENSANSTVTLLGNAKLEATFASIPKDLTLTMSVSGSGSVSPSIGNHTVKSGTPLEIKATANAENFFNGWSCTEGAFIANSSSDTTTVVLDSDATVTANFTQNAPVKKQLSIVVKGFGKTEPANNIELIAGLAQQIKAIPDTGYVFKNWTITNGNISDMASPITMLTITDDAILTANFEPGSSKLTMSVLPEEAGFTIPTAGVVNVTNGTPQPISAIENTGFIFTNWSALGNAAINNIAEKNTSVILFGDATVVANFAVKNHKVTFTANEHGRIEGNKLQIIPHGQDCSQVTALPDENYLFEKWTGDYEGTENPLILKNIVSDMNLTANFSHIKANLTIAVEGNGTTNPSAGTTPIDTQTPFEITAKPAEGWHFINWTASENGTLENPYSATTKIIITGDAIITAKFEINKYTLKYTAGDNGSLTGETSQTVEHGSDGTPVTAVPNDGYYFAYWSDKNTDNPRTDKNVTGNIDVTAQFIEIPASAKLTMAITPAGAGSTNPTNATTKDLPTLTAIEISALPAKGYYFKEWTAEPASNVIFMKTMPRNKRLALSKKLSSVQTIKLLGDITITANFEAMEANSKLTMLANPTEGAKNITPALGQSEQQTGILVSIEATPAENYHFVNWTTTEGAKITNKSSAKTTLTLYFDATVTANFAENGQANAILTLQASPTEGGKTEPNGAIQIQTGVAFEVKAVASEGFIFVNWSSNNASATIESPSSETTNITISSDTVLTANFAKQPNLTDMAMGRTYKYTDINSQKFVKNPKVFALYADLLSGKPGKKASLKITENISSPTENLNLEWKARIPLINKKNWDKTLTCEDNLMDADVMGMDSCPTQLYVNGKNTGIELNMVPPEITGVFDSKGTELFAVSLKEPQDRKIIIRGRFFGTTLPLVYMEYEKDRQIKSLKLKADKSLKYQNAKGKASCMDIKSAISEITVYLPKTWTDGWDHSEEHNIVIDNKVGKSFWPFQTEE